METVSLCNINSFPGINVHLLRQQQIRLGLLKAARTIFSQQENLQQIMAHPSHQEEESHYSLFQQLLSAATRPSPIKAMFGRDELEVHNYKTNTYNMTQICTCTCI